MGQVIKTTIDGEELEFESMGMNAAGATHVFLGNGNIQPRQTDQVHDHLRYLRLIPKQHTFGGVVFEERGPRRNQYGEWFLSDRGYPTVSSGEYDVEMGLRPVSLKA